MNCTIKSKDLHLHYLILTTLIRQKKYHINIANKWMLHNDNNIKVIKYKVAIPILLGEVLKK